MEKRECKLCFKRFSNGRALGGHMKSHMAILQTPPKIEQTRQQIGNETESTSSSSSDENEEEEEEEVKTGLYYGLRENPKKSFRLVDPVFSSTMDVGSIVLDRESETESFKNPTRRRSKRNRISKHQNQNHQNEEPELKKLKSIKPIKVESPVESEPVSSVSDNTPEEDVALCLMMLSRDTWMKEEEEEVAEKSVEKMDDDDDDDSEEIIKFCPSRIRKKYQCESCKKVFKSYQALGGHRANHKKINGCIPSSTSKAETQNGSNAGGDRRIHKCPICFRIFRSKQALGGHKRIHISDLATATTTTTSNSAKFKDNLIDLNLPAPIEDGHISQVEISVVSGTEFVDLI
ncbi:zinc finger protein [Macleaya cordata]|uniref:Zinc finger protein n=1 Tax=Macleaya cordata TaxID=56857 RepID=A0A200PXY0_MACCD|nr:zinc finger protein [Macleaya cordata]